MMSDLALQHDGQRRRRVVLVLGLLMLLLLAACSEQAAETPPATAVVALQPPTAAPTATPAPTNTPTLVPTSTPTRIPIATPTATPTPIHPLSIEYLRRQEYPGSPLVIEQTLAPGANYDRYIASYDSEGLKQYGLLTVPRGQKPANGWPVIIFNHGYIPPAQYRTTQRYVAYVDGFARSGYIVFRPDYRGHDQSEGQASGAYGSPDYVIDVLNAVASLKVYPDADPTRIGMWGHSMGGWITLRAMVTSPDIKAGVIWGGVVGSYEDLMSRWRRGNNPPPTPDPNSTRGRWRNGLVRTFGTPESNPEMWRTLSANYYLQDLSGPIQLHHARGDASVPVEFSEILYQQGIEAGMPIELYTYAGDNHNISGNFNTAMRRSVEFFNRTLAQPAALNSTTGPTVFARSGTVNLRSGPGTTFAIVGSLSPNQPLPITGRNADSSWWQVQTATGPAWVANSVVTAVRHANVPVVDTSGTSSG